MTKNRLLMLGLRAFNGESDALIRESAMEQCLENFVRRIESSYSKINKMPSEVMPVKISYKSLQLKINDVNDFEIIVYGKQ